MSRRSLTVRLAAWIAAIFLASMALLGLVVYLVVYVEERDEGPRAATETSAEVATDVEEEVATALAIAAPLGLAVAVGGAVWIARRTIAPVASVIRAATEITAQRLDLRLPVPPTEDELAALVQALNGLLLRLESGFAAEKRFAELASHELRTPLAVMTTRLEVALRRPRDAAEWAATGADVLDETRRLSRLVDALLRLRRVEVGPAAAATAELGAVVEEVATRSAEAARARGVTLEVEALLPAHVRANHDELVAAVGNVVANAIRVSPPGAAVAVHGEQSAGAVALHVDDAGPGLAPGEEARVFAPFVRGRAGQGTEGFGLGLAIARAVAESAGGGLTAATDRAQGARFTFRLPTA